MTATKSQYAPPRGHRRCRHIAAGESAQVAAGFLEKGAKRVDRPLIERRQAAIRHDACRNSIRALLAGRRHYVPL